jgi:hypothetical protein
MTLPENREYELITTSREDIAHADAFKIIDKDSKEPQYLLYLLVNQSNLPEVSEADLIKYTADLGQFEIVSTQKEFINNITIYKIELIVDSNVKGALYLRVEGDVLYRTFFMLPNRNDLDYNQEMTMIMSEIKYLKNKWD